MYKIVYPETEEEVVPIQFYKPWEAADYWENNRGTMWINIESKHPRDFCAFMQTITGEIVVVRSFDVEGNGCHENH